MDKLELAKEYLQDIANSGSDCKNFAGNIGAAFRSGNNELLLASYKQLEEAADNLKMYVGMFRRAFGALPNPSIEN